MKMIWWVMVPVGILGSLIGLQQGRAIATPFPRVDDLAEPHLRAEQPQPPEELTRVERLQADLNLGQSTLQPRVSALENQVKTLEAQQFSPTTLLQGEAVMGLVGVAGTMRADRDKPLESRPSLGYRIRLNFTTSFTGKDTLRFRLQARDIPELEEVTGTQMANLGFDGLTNQKVEMDRLDYETKLTPNLQAKLLVIGGGLGDFVPTVNPLFSSSGSGSISNFGRENPIRRLADSPGLGLSYDVTRQVNLALGYVAPRGNDPEQGLFGGRYGAIAQITLKPQKALRLGLTYVRSFNGVGTGTGSELGEDPFDDESEAILTQGLGAEVSWEIAPKVVLGGRTGYLWATAQDLEARPTAEIFTWSASLGLVDLGGKGNLAGFIVGTPPQVLRNQFDQNEVDADAALHLELFYRMQINDFLAITPGLIIIQNPEHRSSEPLYIGTIRTTLTF